MNRLLIAGIVASMVMVGCSRNTTAPDDGGIDEPPSYTVSGVFGIRGWTVRGKGLNMVMDYTYIYLSDSAGNPLSGASVVINGYTIPEVETGAYGDTLNVLYEAGQTYDIEVTIDSTTGLNATITAPPVDSVVITSPFPGDTLPYDSLTLNWQVYGTPGTSMLVVILNDSLLSIDNQMTSYTLDTALVLEMVRTSTDGTIDIGVAYFNRLDFPELVSGSYYMVGTFNFTTVYVDTTR